MNKLFSLIIFTVALAWSWNIVHSTPAIGFETHSGIQQKLAQLIQNIIQTKKPNAKNLQITRLWTETLDQNKVRAVFAYRFEESENNDDNTLEQTIEGEAILHREPSDNAQVDKWVVQQVRTTNDNVIFKNDTIVTPTPNEDEEPALQATPPSSVKETKAHE